MYLQYNYHNENIAFIIYTINGVAYSFIYIYIYVLFELFGSLLSIHFHLQINPFFVFSMYKYRVRAQLRVVNCDICNWILK